MCHIARDTPLLVSLRQIQNPCHGVAAEGGTQQVSAQHPPSG